MKGPATHAWKRLKHVTAIKGGAGFPHEEQGLLDEELPFYKVGDLERAAPGGTLSEPEHTVSRDTAKRLGAYVFQPGSVVFAKVGAALMLNRFRQLPGEACLDNNMMGLEPLPNAVTQRFLKYAMASKDLSVIANPGAVPSVNASQIAEERIWCPDVSEQKRIVNFLDEQTARIDALIAEKEKLQETLGEWRAAEVSRICFGAATASERTGNAWVPILPLGWRLVRLKHLVLGIEQGWSPECESRPASADEWGVLKAGAANGGMFRESENKALPAHLEARPDLEVKAGDVIATRASGSADLVGSFAFVSSVRPKLMLSDKNFRLRFNSVQPLQPELIAWICGTPTLREQIKQFVSGADGLAKNIGSGNLRELWLPVPPANLQAAMLGELRHVGGTLDVLESHLVNHLERLREYRSSLISAAVTGQLDVGAVDERRRLAE